ncbi:hypothetical protein V2A60_008448 [Cordyceps javanica]
MKQTILVQLLAAFAAAAPVVDGQQAGIDATALGQAWIKKIQELTSKDKDIDSAVKTALINNMSKCTLTGIQPLSLDAPTDYEPRCPTVYDGSKGSATALDAAALGQAWIAAAGSVIGNDESPQTRQKLLGSITSCTISRSPGLLLGDPDEFYTFCASVTGDVPSAAGGAGPAVDEKSDGTTAQKEFLAPASVEESDDLCGPLSGHSAVDSKGTSEACVGTEAWCLRGLYRGTSEDFTNADECIASRAADEDAIHFPSN